MRSIPARGRARRLDLLDAPGEAAFYGPKLDPQERPIMIHRGTVSSMERVTAALLERYQGRLPLWLAPVQVCVLPAGPGQGEAAAGAVQVTDIAGKFSGQVAAAGLIKVAASAHASRQARIDCAAAAG